MRMLQRLKAGKSCWKLPESVGRQNMAELYAAIVSARGLGGCPWIHKSCPLGSQKRFFAVSSDTQEGSSIRVVFPNDSIVDAASVALLPL